MKLDTQISLRTILAIIYETYHIVRRGQAIPFSLLTVEGLETLVNDGKIPRDMATLVYKLLFEIETETNK